MPRHRKQPYHIPVNHGNIGVLPSSARCGVPLVESYKYLTHWLKGQQIFNFSGQHNGISNTVDTGKYYFVTKRPAKRDTGNPKRLLGGAIIPWRISASNAATWDHTPYIKYTADGESIVTLKEYKQGGTIIKADDYWGVVDGDTIYGARIIKPYPVIELFDDDNFSYTSDGTYQMHIIETHNILVAALGIWELPDKELTTTQEHIGRSKFYPGKPVKVADLIYDTGYVSASHDGTIANTSRCLFQFGHPIGYYFDGTLGVGTRPRINFFYWTHGTTTTAIDTIKIRDDHFMSTQEHAAEMVIVVTTNGATETNPAIIHYYSMETGDSNTETITSDVTATLLTGSEIDIEGDDEIVISVTPPGTTTAHYINIHTLALFTNWGDY